MPVYEQGQTNSCYAYAATAAIDVWRKARGKSVPPYSSPIEAALRYAVRQPGRTTWRHAQGGNPQQVLEILLSEGTCPHVSPYDFSQEVVGKRWNQLSRVASARDEYQDQEDRKKRGKNTSGLFSKKTPDQKQDEVVRDVSCEVEGPTPSSSTVEKLDRPIRDALMAATSLKSAQEVFALGCKKSGVLSVPQATLKKRESPAWMNHDQVKVFFQKSLDESFSKGDGSVPVITYCPRFLLYPSSKDAVIEQGYYGSCKSGSVHASVILGRRRNDKGQCEYLIHNSWGSSCDPYSWPCEKGQVWVPIDALMNNLLELSWLE